MPSESFIQLGEFRYFPNKQRLFDKDDQELKLRPQSLAVLDLLASSPGDIFSKDQIFDTVWKDVSVTDDSLVQCIGDIRRVLDDKNHKILETVPRRGYQLLADPSVLIETTKPDTESKIPLQGANASSGLSKRPTTAILTVVGLLILAGLSFLFWQKSSEVDPVKVVAASDAPTLSVSLTSDNQTSGETLAAILQELRVALGRYSTIRLVDKNTSEQNADYSLTLDAHGFGKKGSIRQTTMELQGAKDTQIVFAESYDVPAEENAIHNVAIRAAAAVASPGLGAIAQHLRKTSRLKPIEELTPSECYVYGYGCSKCSGEEDNITQRAEACLAHRIKENPDDARAWGLQATIYAHQYWYGNTLPEPQRSTLSLRKHLPDLAIKAANKAEALSSGGDSSVYWGMAEAYMASCQSDKLHTAVQRGLEINPDDPNLLASFGNWLSYSGRWREGAELTQRALNIEPKNYRKWWWMGIAKTHYRFDEDEQAYAAFMKAFNERNWVSHLQLAYTLPYLGRVDEARAAVKNMLRLYPGVTLERALEFYKVLCFDDTFLNKMKKALVVAGLPSRGDSDDFNNIQPPTAKIIKVNGIDIEYMDVGEGEPVIFIHGAEADYRSWGYYMLPISENHRFISYSRRYHGTQPWLDKGNKWSAQTFADDLSSFIKALDIGPVHLVSWSNGSPIAYLVKDQHPELVKSAIHYEPVTIDPLIGNTPEEEATKKQFFGTWSDVFSQLKTGDTEKAANRFMETVFELKAGEYSHEKEITKQLFRQNARTLPVMFNPNYRQAEGISCDFLKKIKIPTLIIHGEKTNQYWSLMAKKFAECTPNAILKTMRGVNHKAPIEDFDGLSKLIIEFVEIHKDRSMKKLGTEPSIVIYPFKNLTDNPRWGRLAEGLSGDIANELARNQWFFVTAPLGQSENAGKSNQSTNLNDELQNRYILSGSVQAENNDLRISARLTNQASGKIIWSQRWDRPARAIFAIQDEILQKVEAAIGGAWSGVVAKEDLNRARYIPTSNLDAYELFLLGTEYKHKFTPEADEIAASYFMKAVEADPSYSKAWATLAVLRANQSVAAPSKVKRSQFDQFRQVSALKAYEANPKDPDALLQISWLKGKKGDFKAAEEALRQAVDFSPNNPDVLAHAAWVGSFRSPVIKEDALAWGNKAIGLSEMSPPWYMAGLGIAAFYAEDYQLSLNKLKNAPDMADVLIHRAAAAALLGDATEIASAVKRFKEIVPEEFTVLEYTELNGFHKLSQSQLIKGARLAGLPIGDEKQ